MAWNRKAIAERVAHSTVDIVFAEVAKAGEREVGPADAGRVANAGIDKILAEIAGCEKAAEQGKAESMFPLETAEAALAAKRRLARYASMARNRATWIVAECAGRTESDCEQYRAASSVRLDVDTLASELAKMLAVVGLDMIPCPIVKGRLAKAKASPAACVALASLQNALAVQQALSYKAQKAA